MLFPIQVVFHFKIGDEGDYGIDSAEKLPCYVNFAIILVITIMVFTLLMVTMLTVIMSMVFEGVKGMFLRTMVLMEMRRTMMNN